MEYCNSIDQCRLCGGKVLDQFIDLGSCALANDYDNEHDEFPLEVVKCAHCGLHQLNRTVSSRLLFSNYNYVSPPNLVPHWKEYALTVSNRLGLGEFDRILEIGGNSGDLCKEFKKLGFDVSNVEPANNIAQISVKNNINTYNNFFNREFVDDYLKFNEKVDLVVSNNCLAHLSDFHTVFDGIQNILSPNGFLVFENAYFKNTIENNDFGQIYSEHTVYHTIAPLFKYFHSRGMTLFDIEFVDVQCGSFRMYVANKANYPITHRLDKVAYLDEINFILSAGYDEFNADIQTLKRKILNHLNNGKYNRIGLCGVPAKAALLIKYFELEKYIDFAYDDAQLKVGKEVPGTKIPIKSMSEIGECDAVIIGAYNFADDLMNKLRNYKMDFIVPIPEFRVIKSR